MLELPGAMIAVSSLNAEQATPSEDASTIEVQVLAGAQSYQDTRCRATVRSVGSTPVLN